MIYFLKIWQILGNESREAEKEKFKSTISWFQTNAAYILQVWIVFKRESVWSTKSNKRLFMLFVLFCPSSHFTPFTSTKLTAGRTKGLSETQPSLPASSRKTGMFKLCSVCNDSYQMQTFAWQTGVSISVNNTMAHSGISQPIVLRS